MKKLFTVIVLMVSLLAANAADAKFSDEYKARHPGRVKVKTSLEASGKKSTLTKYQLFERRTANGNLSLTIWDTGYFKFCYIAFSSFSGSPVRFTNFAWGDGEKAHDIKTDFSYVEKFRRGGDFHRVAYTKLFTKDIADLKQAVILSIRGGGSNSTPLLYTSHKRWKEWQDALVAAEKFLNEK